MTLTCDNSTFEDSPFFTKIASAIEKYKNKADGIWVSITPEAEAFTPKGESESILVKWLSWSLTDSEGNELFDPPLLLVHPGLTESQIKHDLAKHFPNLKREVDNEIYFDDE